MRYAHTIDGSTIRTFQKVRDGRIWHQYGHVEQQERNIYDDQEPPNIIGTELVDVWVLDDPPAGTYLTSAVEAAPFDWFPVDETAPRPAETVDTYYQRAYTFSVDQFVLSWTPVAKTQEQIDAEAAAAAAKAAQEADDADRDAKLANVGGQVATLRAWAYDADWTTVDAQNAVATLQVVVNRFGLLCDRFADLIEGRRIDQG